MKALRFNLSGKTAFFKKPDVNTYCYFTYSNIHKVALLGILGAICGYSGYNQQKKGENVPEFYDKLKDIKVSIVPSFVAFNKKMQVFNNSVGYASQERGGNLIVKEQWLENPSWDIYVLLEDNDVCDKFVKNILNEEFTYIPYLGKNDHFANIAHSEILELEKPNRVNKIDSLFAKEIVESFDADFEYADDDQPVWKYQEFLPIGFEQKTNQYILKKFIFTNSCLIVSNLNNLYSDKEKMLFFF